MAKIHNTAPLGIYPVNGGYHSRKFSNTRSGIIKSYKHNNPHLHPARVADSILAGAIHGIGIGIRKIGEVISAIAYCGAR